MGNTSVSGIKQVWVPFLARLFCDLGRPFNAFGLQFTHLYNGDSHTYRLGYCEIK